MFVLDGFLYLIVTTHKLTVYSTERKSEKLWLFLGILHTHTLCIMFFFLRTYRTSRPFLAKLCLPLAFPIMGTAYGYKRELPKNVHYKYCPRYISLDYTFNSSVFISGK
jgi:hypothetical protein